MVLPAHGAKRPFKHAADTHRLRADVELSRLPIQRALRLVERLRWRK
jgi:hypothetical protein